MTSPPSSQQQPHASHDTSGYITTLVLLAVALTIFRLWLSDFQRLTAIGNAGHDDRLFLQLTQEILNGAWLGPYNQMTLAKGPFYPLWIAGVYQLGLPLLLAQQMLYVAACVFSVMAMQPLLRSHLTSFVFYWLLLFAPTGFTNVTMTQVMRDGIYPALTLLTISAASGLFLRANERTAVLVRWAVALGIVLSAFWLTREEGVWLMPTLVLLCAFTLFVQRRDTATRRSRALLLTIPVVLSLSIVGAIAGINKALYGVFTVSELQHSSFQAAYGALTRVAHRDWNPTVPVPREVRERIYVVSPAFRELQPFLDAQTGTAWLSMFRNIRELATKDAGIRKRLAGYLTADPTGIWSKALHDDTEIHGGLFMWAFRDAVSAAGYHTSGNTAAAYYARLAAEIDAACAKGMLACANRRASLMPPWHRQRWLPFLATLCHGMLSLASAEGFDPVPEPSRGTSDQLMIFKTFTRTALSPSEFNIKGWVFRPQGIINLSIVRPDGTPLDLPIHFLPSPDVYNHFLAAGREIPSAQRARFWVSAELGKDFSACQPTCYLQISNGDNALRRIPLDGTLTTISTPDLYLHFENLGIKNAFTKAENTAYATMGWIGTLYLFTVPILAGLGLCTFFLVLVHLFRHRTFHAAFLVASAIAIAIIARLVLLALIHITSFPAITPQYLSPAYPLLLAFSFLSISAWVDVHKARS